MIYGNLALKLEKDFNPPYVVRGKGLVGIILENISGVIDNL